MRGLVAVLILLHLPSLSLGETAVYANGQRVVGVLIHQKDRWFFRSAASKTLVPIETLRSIDFADRPTPVSLIRPLHRVHLGEGESMTGELAEVGDKVRLRSSMGKTIELPRSKTTAITVPDDWLSIVVADFDKNLDGIEWYGPRALASADVGAPWRPVRVEPDAEPAGFRITAVARGALRASLLFRAVGGMRPGAFQIRFSFTGDESATFSLSGHGYELIQPKGDRIAAGGGLHLLQLEWGDGEAKAFVDDFFVGRWRIRAGATLQEVRVMPPREKARSPLELECFHLATRLGPTKSQATQTQQDEIWLPARMSADGNDQVYGTLLSAGPRQIALRGRFGDKSWPWSKVRAIYFRGEAAPPPNVGAPAVEAWLRSSPGYSEDRVRGLLVPEGDSGLALRHPWLGVIPLAAERLTRLVLIPAVKK